MEWNKDFKVNDGGHGDETGKEVEKFELHGNEGLCKQLIDKITSMPPEVRTQFDYSIAAQGAGVKIPRSGLRDIEVTPPKVFIKISPKQH
jgi:hypothetical protein